MNLISLFFNKSTKGFTTGLLKSVVKDKDANIIQLWTSLILLNAFFKAHEVDTFWLYTLVGKLWKQAANGMNCLAAIVGKRRASINNKYYISHTASVQHIFHAKRGIWCCAFWEGKVKRRVCHVVLDWYGECLNGQRLNIFDHRIQGFEICVLHLLDAACVIDVTHYPFWQNRKVQSS